MSNRKKKGSDDHRSSLRTSRNGVAAAAAAGASQDGPTPEEQARQAAIDARNAQKDALEEAIDGLALRAGNPGEDNEAIQTAISRLEERIFDLDREIGDLEASVSLRFPSANQITALGNAIGLLQARIAASAAVSAVVAAAGAVMTAFGF